MAKKGDLKAVMHLNIGLDESLSKALERSAAKNERRLTEEARYHIRQGLSVEGKLAEDQAGVSV